MIVQRAPVCQWFLGRLVEHCAGFMTVWHLSLGFASVTFFREPVIPTGTMITSVQVIAVVPGRGTCMAEVGIAGTRPGAFGFCRPVGGG